MRPLQTDLSKSVSHVLRGLIGLNALMGALIFTLLMASLVAQDIFTKGLGIPHARASSSLFIGMRLIMVLGICAVPVVHLVFTRLLRILDTVRSGDPFVSANAARLQAIAWALLLFEVMHYAVAAIAASIRAAGVPLDIRWDFSLTRWIAVLLLFVLARVFEQGARMREDLQGTV